MAIIRTVFIVLALTCLMVNTAATRELRPNPGFGLASRLETSGGIAECWDALMEIKSCTNEIIFFFLNGQTVLGPECCRAIRFIMRDCWPAMLTSLGFTTEEGNILQGYCDTGPPAPASPPLYQVKMG